MKIQSDNQRLYDNILDIDNKLQFSFLGLHKTRFNQVQRALHAGFMVNKKNQRGNEFNYNSILQKDRL